MALAFAARYRPLAVVVGIGIAAAIVHGISVGVGVVFAANLPTQAIRIVAGLAFLAFGAWTLRGGGGAAGEGQDRPAPSLRSSSLTVGLAFLLAELGDKTMIATITLATEQGALATWAGATLGMVAADGLAIVVGRALGTRLPERPVRLVAAATFLVFGTLLLIQAARG